MEVSVISIADNAFSDSASANKGAVNKGLIPERADLVVEARNPIIVRDSGLITYFHQPKSLAFISTCFYFNPLNPN